MNFNIPTHHLSPPFFAHLNLPPRREKNPVDVSLRFNESPHHFQCASSQDRTGLGVSDTTGCRGVNITNSVDPGKHVVLPRHPLLLVTPETFPDTPPRILKLGIIPVVPVRITPGRRGGTEGERRQSPVTMKDEMFDERRCPVNVNDNGDRYTVRLESWCSYMVAWTYFILPG